MAEQRNRRHAGSTVGAKDQVIGVHRARHHFAAQPGHRELLENKRPTARPPAGLPLNELISTKPRSDWSIDCSCPANHCDARLVIGELYSDNARHHPSFS